MLKAKLLFVKTCHHNSSQGKTAFKIQHLCS